MMTDHTAGRQADRAQVECLYRIWSVLDKPDSRLENVLDEVVAAIPASVRHPESCRVRIALGAAARQSPDFRPSPWCVHSEIRVRGQVSGTLEVSYDREPAEGGEPFSADERRLFEAVAARVGSFIEMQELLLRPADASTGGTAFKSVNDWRALLGLLLGTNLDLVFRLSHRMFVRLRLGGVSEADGVAQRFVRTPSVADEGVAATPGPAPRTREETVAFCEDVFRLAARHLSDEEIFTCVQRWMHEEKCNAFVRTIANPESTLRETSDAIRFLGHVAQQGVELPDSLLNAVNVHLIQRFLSDRLEFVQIAKDHLTKEDFQELIRRIVYQQGSHGKLGAKGARLFVAAHVLQRQRERSPELKRVRTPKTWFVTTDCLNAFLYYNDFQDLTDQKYKTLDQIREEYPLIVQFFRQAQFPSEVVRGLAMALDDFGDVPLIVRSSSLLEDQLGAAFSGMYASRFVPNRGRKSERLQALLDAIAEVYASVYSADPIGLRAERGLIDFEEDVGLMVQEVVGIPVGKYFFPPFAGLARPSGMRLVFGLGTLLSEDDSEAVEFRFERGARKPPMPGATPQRRMTVINREEGRVETIEIGEMLKSFGQRMVGLERIISSPREGRAVPFSPAGFDHDRQPWAVSFEGLVHDTPFIAQMRAVLDALLSAFRWPLEVAFASDGHDIQILDCRPLTQRSDIGHHTG